MTPATISTPFSPLQTVLSLPCLEFKTKSSDLFYFANHSSNQAVPAVSSLLSPRPFGEVRFAIPRGGGGGESEDQCETQNNLNDLLIRQFKLPSAVETRMANVCRETKEIKGERI